MRRSEDLCPQPEDIEPVCFDFCPEKALAHAEKYVERFELDYIRPAIGLIIPSLLNPNQILYGLRNPMYKEEFPNAWGLPSSSIPINLCQRLTLSNGEMNTQAVLEAINILADKKQKLPHILLFPERIVGWAGKVRFRSAGYDSNYYLIMIDIRTRPVSPNDIPSSSVAYIKFSWLTPDEHKKIAESSPSKACGTCSALAYEAFHHNE